MGGTSTAVSAASIPDWSNTRAKEAVFASLEEASAAQTILTLNDTFGGQSYNLQDIFPEERHRIMRLLSQDTLLRLDQLYSQVYRDNYGIFAGFPSRWFARTEGTAGGGRHRPDPAHHGSAAIPGERNQ